MRSHSCATIGFVWLSLASSACAAQRPAESRPDYDGTWWLSISDAERSGFVVGFLDCYGADYAGPVQFTTKSYDSYRDLITDAYKRDRSQRDAPIARVIERLGDKPNEAPESPGGDPVNEPHYGNDGLYWIQMSSHANGHDEQRGFVEGYLYCHHALDHDKRARFTKTADAYIPLIDRWYGYDPHTGDVDGDRQPRPIADALFALRDHHGRSARR